MSELSTEQVVAINESLRTPRTYSEYAVIFGYSTTGEELRGKRILDVGAGDSSFATTARAYDIRVTRLDAKYADAKKSGIEGQPPKDPNNAVSAAMQHLPFSDNSFDEVVASSSLLYLPEKDVKPTLEEMIRVVGTDGKVKIYPVYFKDEITDESLPLPLDATIVKGPDQRYPNAHTLIIPKGSVTEDNSQAGLDTIISKIRINDLEWRKHSSKFGTKLSKINK